MRNVVEFSKTVTYNGYLYNVRVTDDEKGNIEVLLVNEVLEGTKILYSQRYTEVIGGFKRKYINLILDTIKRYEHLQYETEESKGLGEWDGVYEEPKTTCERGLALNEQDTENILKAIECERNATSHLVNFLTTLKNDVEQLKEEAKQAKFVNVRNQTVNCDKECLQELFADLLKNIALIHGINCK